MSQGETPWGKVTLLAYKEAGKEKLCLGHCKQCNDLESCSRNQFLGLQSCNIINGGQRFFKTTRMVSLALQLTDDCLRRTSEGGRLE